MSYRKPHDDSVSIRPIVLRAIDDLERGRNYTLTEPMGRFEELHLFPVHLSSEKYTPSDHNQRYSQELQL